METSASCCLLVVVRPHRRQDRRRWHDREHGATSRQTHPWGSGSIISAAGGMLVSSSTGRAAMPARLSTMPGITPTLRASSQQVLRSAERD